MSGRLSLRRNFTWASAGNIIKAGCSCLMMVALTNLLEDVEDVGRFGLAIAVSTPVIMFSNLHLRTVYATDVRNEYSFSEYLALRFLTVILGTLIVLGVVIYGGYGIASGGIIVLWCLAQNVVNVKDSYQGIMQKYERMDKVSISKSVQSVLSLIVFAGSLFFFNSLYFAVIGVIAVRLAVMLFYDIGIVVKLRESDQVDDEQISLLPVFNSKAMLRLFWLTAPLGVSLGFISLMNNIPRYFVEHYHGLEQLGYFTPIVYFITVGNMAVIALAQSAAPRLAIYFNDNLRAYRRLLIRLGLIGFGVGICGVLFSMLFGGLILRIFKPEYAAYKNVLVIIMIGAVPYYISSFLNDGLLVARRIKIQIVINGLSVIVVLLASWNFVPSGGLAGAGWSIAAGSLVQMLMTLGVNIYSYYRRKNELAFVTK